MRGNCPRCGSHTLFTRLAALHERCASCGLDFTEYDLNRRAAELLALLLGGLIAFLAVRIDLWLRPPLLLHLLWTPLTILAVVVVLRSLKALSVARGYVEKGR